jgi:DNA modification methylase
MFSVKGDTILDPFLGSGTTTKAAVQNGRNSVGYESDNELLQIIKKKTENSAVETDAEINITTR